MKRTPKGSITVEEFKGRLRLYWSWQGKRFYLYIGLPDTEANRKAAEIKARQIELDIASNNFDPTLLKYKPTRQEAITVVELYEKFVTWKKSRIAPGTLTKYEGLRSHLSIYFKNRIAVLSELEAEKFRDWLMQRLEPITVRERIVMLSACWNWGIKKKLVQENPWLEVQVSVPLKQPPQPFTQEEIIQIVQKFRCDPKLKHYADYVEFKFGVGARTGEIAALRWRHVSPDCSRIWIGESGTRNSTKNNKARYVPLTLRLQQILTSRKTVNSQPDDLIFTSLQGKIIDSKNFCNRYWKPALQELNIKFRPPYQTRHTLISHALEQGMNPVNLARLTGHNPKTLFDYYAGVVRPPELPDLLSSAHVFAADSQAETPNTSESFSDGQDD
ncbi:MAG: tyrosine-type recombinase/integrase [Phormidium sp.]